MKKALLISKQIKRNKTAWGKRKAVLRWCSEVKKAMVRK